MSWVAFAGIFFLGGLFGMFFISLFVAASDGLQKRPGSDLEEERSPNPDFPFRKVVGDQTSGPVQDIHPIIPGALKGFAKNRQTLFVYWSLAKTRTLINLGREFNQWP